MGRVGMGIEYCCLKEFRIGKLIEEFVVWKRENEIKFWRNC